ncbi:endonuclease/exonuclease/phosphatase family protein [Phenylobacterium sp.]|jgi:endonuclease/exonuclease/phosphatase (EEP) superfamily protein YafD|uniref:endonuclease/exonuclease/phosphatase family protein n=1 Tax=Phenylobacterium sp. TaxID=1871053 RepID=UPI002E34C982|nr:endonuclease/exonuclease/phosphatase family protein [Phenylobacterium sp.]HEX3364956.1 endonuclease/exonuclease/phosphatase family protein [Phenylobacterium sp.]
MRSIWLTLRWCLEAAAAALALMAAAAAVGAEGGRWNDKLDLLSHFALIWLAAGVLAFILSWVSPSVWRGSLIRVAALVAILAAGGLILPDFTRQRSPRAEASAPHQVKLIEFNQWGENSDPDRVVAWIAAQHPDLVIVVEPTPALEPKMRQVTGLETVSLDGSLIATRHPVVKIRHAWDTHELPGRIFFMNWPEVYGFDGKPFTLMGVHIGWPIPARRARAETLHLTLTLDTIDRPSTILAGDFNSTQWSYLRRQAEEAIGLERRDRALPSWPARLPMLHGRDFPFPFLPIDHIYAGSLWRTVKVERGPKLGSDHYPLIATLAWDGPVGGDPSLWPGR